MHLGRRSAALVGLLAGALLAAPPAYAAPDAHSSDGERGVRLTVPDRPGPAERSVRRSWRLAPGVGYREWTASMPQGAVRMHLLGIDLTRPGVTVDLASGPTTTRRSAVSRLVARADAVAGVNADFFDLGGSGAPLGVGLERERGLRHGPRVGWNSCLRIDAEGRARIGTVRVRGGVSRDGRRVVDLGGLNSPVVRPDRVVLYTPAWGRRPGARLLGEVDRARQVGIVDGVVRWSTAEPRSGGPVRGQVLLGRGRGADALARLRVGDEVRVATTTSARDARVVACGSTRLLHDGAPVGLDDPWLHPRTAVGVDRDTGRLLLLVADGRSRRSAGLTLRQLARQLRALGADEALNLDGGGSSTLVAPDRLGRAGVRNRPSDGEERRVPNALVVRAAP